jgi:hypothetical protein
MKVSFQPEKIAGLTSQAQLNQRTSFWFHPKQKALVRFAHYWLYFSSTYESKLLTREDCWFNFAGSVKPADFILVSSKTKSLSSLRSLLALFFFHL